MQETWHVDYNCHDSGKQNRLVIRLPHKITFANFVETA